jgi:AraC-like DNA-binding protein
VPSFDDLVFAPYIRDADLAGRSPWLVPERRLLDYLLVFIQQGKCRFVLDGEVLRLESGAFCLIQPGQSIELRGVTHTITPYAHFDVFYNPRRGESFATRPGQMNLAPYRELMQPALNDLDGIFVPTQFAPPSPEFCDDWLRIVKLWSSGDHFARLEASQRLGILLLQLRKHFAGQSNAQGMSAVGRRDFGWIPSYLSTHLSQPISVADMARRARLSSSRFHAVFQNEFGVAPGRYLLEMRVRHAAELLTGTDWTLAHIASLCGFADVHHFARTFKRLTGSTPGAHRRGEKLR